MKTVILLLCLALSSFSYSDMNPDGYIGGFSVELGTSVSPSQNWYNSVARTFTNSSIPDTKESSTFRNSYSSYGLDLNLMFPFTQSLSLNLGSFYNYDTLSIQESYARTLLVTTSGPAPTPFEAEGASNYNNDHGTYGFRASIKYYFLPR